MRQARVRLLSAVGLACVFAQTPSVFADLADLDKGHRILLERGLQVLAEAVDQPEIPNWSVFDAGEWNAVDFAANFYAPSEYLGPAPGNHVWSAWYLDYAHTSFSQWEAPYASNCVRIQIDDEQNLNDAAVRANTAAWFAAARPNYPDTILCVNQIPFIASDANFRDFMQTSQPDMLMIDSYRWTSDPSQGSWNLLSDWQRHRKFALSGNDGTGAHPIPYGFYAQAVNYGRVPSESELRFEHFAAWAMGYTLTDDFTYNTAAAYSGVESIYFVNGSEQANPTASYYQVQSINAEGKRFGPALVRLLSTDVRFANGYNSSGVQNPNPIDIPSWTQGAGDSYLRGYTVANIGTKNNGYAGDVLLSWFKPLDESLDSTLYSGEKYFAVTNALVDPAGSAADCRQQITLTYDLGTTGIKTIQRLRRDNGIVEVLPLTQLPNGQYTLTTTLDGGTADLFKFNDGAPFVGIPSAGLMYWDSDGTLAGNDAATGAGLGGSGSWDASSPNWYNGTGNGAHSAGANAVFSGAAGAVTLAAPKTINALTFKTTGYNITGSTLTLTSSFISVDSGVGATISSDLAGSVGLTKVGSGTLNLAGANSYSGLTTINAGVLGIASSSFSSEPATPTADVAINNGSTLRVNASSVMLSANRNVSLGTGGGVFDTAGNNATIAGVVSGTSLSKIGSGILALSAVNSYSGGTIVGGGELQISSDANLGAAPASFTAGNITLDGGTLRFGANFDIANTRGITLGAGGGTIDTQAFSNPGGYSPSKGFSGTGNLTKIGAGTFFASATTAGANDVWKGSLVIKEGIWKIIATDGLPYNPPAADGLQPAQITLDGGTWQIGQTVSATNGRRGITVAAGGGMIDTQSFNLTWQGPLAGSAFTAILNKIGSGQLQFNTSGAAPASYAGNFNINGGSVVLNGGGAMGDLAAVNLANTAGVTLTINGATETIGSLSGGGLSGGNVSLPASLVTGANNNSTTFNGLVSGVGGLTKIGGGVFTLARSAGNSYGGGTTVSGGTLFVMNTSGSGTGTGPVTVNAGAVLGGTGTSQGTVTNNGAVTPGSSVGTFHIGGSFTQGAGGRLEIEIASLANHDELAVTGTASLAGTLAVSLLNGFLPQEGNVFEIMTGASFGGSAFTSTSLPALAGGLVWNVNYGATAVALSVVLPGDFNGDGAVDAADYIVWRKGLGTTYTQADYDLWRTHFGASAASGATAGGSTFAVANLPSSAVPEPCSMVLFIAELFAVACCRYRTRQPTFLGSMRNVPIA